MRPVEQLLTIVRTLSKNQDFGPANGISDEQIIQYLNDAQDAMQAELDAAHIDNKPFVTEKIVTLTSGQEAYSIPGRLFYGKELEEVWFSYDGQPQNFRRLDKVQAFNRSSANSDWPWAYWVRNSQIFLVPIPNRTGSTIRVQFEPALDELDKRRGRVITVNGQTATTFTSIVLDATADETSNPNLSTIDYICINDIDGNVKVYNIPVGNYNTGTNTLTPRSGFVYQTGEQIAVGDYVTFGKYSTNVSKLLDECETFLINYAVQRILISDQADEAGPQTGVVAATNKTITDSAKSQSGELQQIPQLDWDEWY